MKAESGLKLRHRKVRRLVTKMRQAMPWLADADLPACRAWAEMELLGAHAFADLETNGLATEKGEPRRLLAEYRQLRQAQLAYERDLGMTPLARMSLRVGDSKARATDVVTALAQQAKTPPAGKEKISTRPPPDGGMPLLPDRAGTGVARKKASKSVEPQAGSHDA